MRNSLIVGAIIATLAIGTVVWGQSPGGQKNSRELGLTDCKPEDSRTPVSIWRPVLESKNNLYFITSNPPDNDGGIVHIEFFAPEEEAKCASAKPDKLYSFAIPDDVDSYIKNVLDSGGLSVNIRGNVQFSNGICYFSGYFINKTIFGVHQGWIETSFSSVDQVNIITSGNFCLTKAN